MNQFMMLVVGPFGQAKNVVQAANDVGAPGATILHARGIDRSGKEGFFHFKIEPEQEIVLIIASKEVTVKISERFSTEYQETARVGSIYILPIKGVEDFVS